MKNSESVRLTEGPLFSKIFLFTAPLMLTGIIQLLYNAADQMVVGRFSGDPNALGAVGSTGSLFNLIVNFLMGFAVGSSVVIAQNYGAKKGNDVSKAVHTSISLALIGGLIIFAVVYFASGPLLILMGTKDVFIDNATLYMKVVSFGVPASAVYNFGATVIRSTGDSKTPLKILSVTGFINVLLNFVFVIFFRLSVAGVALATIISQYLSAIWVMLKLAKSRECFGFRLSKLRISRDSLSKIIFIGLPSGIQNSLFSLSNVFIQTATNTLTPIVISGNAVGGTIESFTYTTMNTFHQSTITITGQNYGAGKMDRVKKTLLYALIQVTLTGVIIGYTEIFFSAPLASIFIDPADPNKALIIDAVALRCRIILGTYFLCGMMEVMSGYLRGLGHSFNTMICSLIGACLLRVVWTQFVFPLEMFNSAGGLYICYPVTWTVTCAALAVFCIIYTKQLKKTH